MSPKRPQRSYDHRLVRLVQETGDPSIATGLGVPKSTAYGWLRRAPRSVTTAPGEDADSVLQLRRENALLKKRLRRLRAILRVLFVLFRIVKPDLAHLRIPAPEKESLLRAVDRTRGPLGLRRVLSLFGLSAARLHAWRVAAAACQLEDQPSCPKTSPQRLTAAEVLRLRQIVTSDDYRHVPTTRLALLAQRLAHVFVSASTLCRLVRVRGWRRPRLRVYPALPREGVRASRPNEIWHVDVTILRLLDGTRAYLHAVIDNFSRRILAWRVTDRLLPGGTVAILLKAARTLATGAVPTLFADSGSENVNGKVDELVEAGLLKRVLAQTDVLSSNSLIEAFWRSLKHQWLFLNSLDTLPRLRSLVAFYVAEHNSKIPHAAFHGQTPDEMYFGTGDHVPETLATHRKAAREARLAANRAARCAVCTA
jgi:transposase InsO family protein